MKKLIFLICLNFCLPFFLFSQKAPLFGRVKVVENFADFRVKIVENFADLDVKKVSFKPSKAGEWQMVENFADFTVQFVTCGEDFSVRWVENLAGVKSPSRLSNSNACPKRPSSSRPK